MSKPANGPSPSVMIRPYWARYDGAPSVDMTCDVVRNPMWSGCANCASKAVKVYSKYVKLFSGAVCTCITLIGAFLTLFLLIDRVPHPIENLKKVYLVAGDIVAPGPVLGNDGFVEWEGAPPQKVMSYFCVKDSGKGPCCLGQAPAACEEAPVDAGSAGTVGVVEAGRTEAGGQPGSASSGTRAIGAKAQRAVNDGGGRRVAVGNLLSAAGSEKVARKGAKARREAGPAEVGSALVRYCGGELVLRDGKSAGNVSKPPSPIGNGGTGIVQPASRCQVIREGEALNFDEKPYTFGGAKRWRNINLLRQANGEYVKCDKKLKGFFSKDKEANAFYEAAIEAEGRGRNGTGRYRMKT